MKNQIIRIVPLWLLLCTLQPSEALPQTPVTLENALLLNGSIVSTDQFARVTRGVIALAGRPPGSQCRSLMPFYIYLKRGGKIVDANAYAHNHSVMRYEIAEILKMAQAGDQLIIDPAEPGNAAGRKIIMIKSTQIVPQFKWFYVLNGKKDNC
ncbi:hypothetical protein [Dyadobacter sp. 676]|uniref:Uncharacterized protein n=1 Tax=Dyadobacter sp. 676 TaxID=3088362 RepID=A0AAU8FR42_9BACT